MAMRLVLCPILWLSLQAYSQVAERPEFKVGDRWRVERVDLWKNEVTSSREVRVVEVSATSTTQEATNPVTGAVISRRITDLDGNTLEFDGRKFDPNYTLYTFPLSVGKKWKNTVTFPSPGRNSTITHKRACEVLALEEIVTKAGTFKAYKIKCDATYTRTSVASGARGFGHLSSTDWFSPEVKRSVRFEYRDTNVFNALWEQYADELVSFELRK